MNHSLLRRPAFGLPATSHRPLFLVVALALASTAGNAQAQSASNSAGSRVQKVIVFADRAEVTRQQTATCQSGTAAAVFQALPDAIDARTLRGETDAPATAVGVAVQMQPLQEAKDARVQALRTELIAIDDELNALSRQNEDEAAQAQERQSYAAYFKAIANEEMRQARPDPSKWDVVLDALQKDRTDSAVRAVERAAQARTLQRRRERTAARLARLRPAEAPAQLAATVAVRCEGKSSVVVRLSYVVPQATWSPEYDLRFNKDGKGKVGKGNAVLTVAGVVTQASGEDWEDATIWLSTAKPQLGGEAPLPGVIYVNGQEETKQKTLVQAQENRAQDLGQGQKVSGVTQVELEDGGKAFVLKLKQRVTVRSDGRPYWFPVDDVTGPAVSSLVAVPARSPYVFQVAALTNRAPYPLLAGRVHVFRGATYVGNTDIEYRAPGEPLEVSLGIDEEIALERKDLKLEKREGNIVSDQEVAHAYRTILRNRSDSDVSVEIREQVPVSKNADIQVTLDAKKTAPGHQLDKLRGHIRWTVALQRGQSAERDIAFTIKLPDSWKLQ
jgi:uncharacterized protein (TIGR02231 family)